MEHLELMCVCMCVFVQTFDPVKLLCDGNENTCQVFPAVVLDAESA
jgi:hypothetical protein